MQDLPNYATEPMGNGPDGGQERHDGTDRAWRSYLTGHGVPRDDAIAAAWLTKAAEQGNQIAQAKLASLYEHGRGVSLDLKRAYIWRLLSLDESTPKPSYELQDLTRLMTAEDVAAAERQAAEWRQSHLATHSSEDDPAVLIESSK